MANPNDTEIEVYRQLSNVQKCVDAFKDVAYNMPEDDRYAAVLSVLTDRLDNEFKALFPLALRGQS